MKRYFFGLFALVLCAACRTVSVELPAPVNYTDETALSREFEETKTLISEKPLQALLRAKRLHSYTAHTETVSALYNEAAASVEQLFQTALKENKPADALRLFRSLAAAGKTPENWSEEKIAGLQTAEWEKAGYSALLQHKTAEKAASPVSLSLANMLDGTVTVWVDRGITIEKGLGRADRMIGSGFFIDKNGFVITNYHVIKSDVDPEYEGYSRVYIKLSGDTAKRIPAKVVSWDPVFDLALLKTEITPKVYFPLGSSKDLKIGSKIYVMGSPAGLEQTLTAGIVSAQNRRLLSLGSVLQIDAPVNHGSSGGPVIDEAGRVQAVVFAGLAQQEGLNFAIPVELLRLILPDLFAGGKVKHSWLGAYGETQQERLPTGEKGVKLIYTLPASPLASIPQGSLITHINGTAVETLEDLQAELMRLAPQTLIVLSGWEETQTDTGEPAASGAETAVSSKSVANAETSSVPGKPAVPDTPAAKTGIRKNWYAVTEARPKHPSVAIYRKDSRVRAMLPLYGFYLETAGRRKAFRVRDVIQGSHADETGFSGGDYLELRSMQYEKGEQTIYTQIYAKRKKGGYLDAFMGLWAYLDSPSYF